MIHRSPDSQFMPPDETNGAKAAEPNKIKGGSDYTDTGAGDAGEDKEIIQAIEFLNDYELEALISRSELVNSGNNGLIYKIDLKMRDEKFTQNKDALEDANQESEKKSKAIKILKVYKEGLGRREYAMQKKAYDIINGAANKEELAQIPKPIFFKELRISREMQEKLNANGATLSDGKAEIILMDYLEAEDLASIIYQWVIDNHPNQNLNPGAHQSIEEMQQTVAMLLGFERPGGKGAGEGDRDLEERKVYIANADKLYRFLQKSGFKMNPSIVSQVKNTLDLLHRNGVYHNDPHERNIMIKGDYNHNSSLGNQENPCAYIVDFGSAAEEKTEGRVDDGYLINRLKELTDSPEETRRKEAVGKLETRLNGMKKSEAWTLRCEGLTQKIQVDAPAALESEFSRALAGEDKLEEFIAILLNIQENGKISKEEIIKFLDEKTKPIPLQTGRKKQAEQTLPPWVRNKLLLYKTMF